MSEHFYKEFSYAFTPKGLAARFAFDKTPEGMYWNLLGVEVRQEEALSSRLGRIPITATGSVPTPLADLNVHTLSRLKGTGGNTWRYAGAGQNLYRRAGDTPGPYTQVSGINQMSGNRFSAATYRPSFSSFPYIFFADAVSMLKDNGSLSPLQQWGIFPPVIPAGGVVSGQINDLIDDFGADIKRLSPGASGYFVPSGFGASLSGTISTVVVTASFGNQNATVVTSAPHGIPISARSGQVNLSGVTTSFNGPWRLATVINATTFTLTRVGTIPGSVSGGQFSVWTDYFRVNTTSPSGIASGVQTVTPVNMTNIVADMVLLIDVGSSVPLANIVARPTTLLNGWGPDGHVGDYEGGVSQGHSFGFDGSTTLPYSNPTLAYDGDNATAATALFQHTHQYAGCVWSFPALGASANPRTLNILSSIPAGVTLRSAGIWYSLDSGATWTNIYNQGTRAQQWDSVLLPGGQDISKVQVMAFLDSHDDMSHSVNEINITESFTQINTGDPEYVVVISTTATTFSASFAQAHGAGTTIQDANFDGAISGATTATLLGIGPLDLDSFSALGTLVPASDSDVITFFMNLSVESNISAIHLQFDVGDGSFTDFYGTPIAPTGGNNAWVRYSTTRGSFNKNGRAGLPGFTWANVSSYRFLVQTLNSVVFKVDNLYMFVPGGLNVGPGSLYDYRYTYFNNQTGDESNPSVPMVSTAFLNPSNQAVFVFVTPSTDPQVTNINIYRRGGTLTTGWTFVAQVSANTTIYVDSFNDSQIASNQLLQLDNDVPLTTTLPVPVNTTIGNAVSGGGTRTASPPSMANIFKNQLLTVDSGNKQEIVIVQSVTATSFAAYFQLSHSIATTIAASTRSGHSVNLVTIAFDQAWFAGDLDNPNRLYYSKVTNPEAVPPQNWIEIGTPADPIMNIVFFSGQIFVETQARFFRVIIPFPGATPTPYPTGARHGLAANFANCIAEGLIPYLSQDGMYVFTGENSSYASEVIEWLLANKEPNLGPVPEQDPIQLVNAVQTQDTIMAFYKNEVFIAYHNKLGTITRLIFDLTKRRWRNDDVQANSMYFEEDTQTLLFGRTTGMIFQDRIGDVDLGIVGAGIGSLPININIQTGAKDQELPLNDKVYNELSLDVDTGGQSLSVSLLFDDGLSTLPLGTFSTTSRDRVYIPINAGQGRISQNVALLITGSVTSVIHLYKWHIKAATEAEFRETFDSYWSKFGTDEWKFLKQGWFEYVAPDPAGITFAVYIEGNTVTPAYTFTLPQATTRTTERVRFPAVKATVWRMVGISPSKFRLYGESFVEFKSITNDKGYNRENLGQMVTAQGSV